MERTRNGFFSFGRRGDVDMTEGSIPKQLIRFSLPLFFTVFLQLLFNAADLIVIGRFCSHECMAAVGSTGALIALFINLFWGLSIGYETM